MILDPLLIFWCDVCEAFQNTCDPNMLTIYYAMDDIENLVDAICECGNTTQERLDAESITRLMNFGVVANHINSFLPPITEREIDCWDIDKELTAFYAEL